MATIDDRAPQLPPHYWIAGLLGAYACLIAASPNALTAAAWSVPLVAIPLVLWTVQTASRWLWCFFFAALLLPPLPFALGDSGPHVGVALAGLGLLCGVLRLPEWRLRLSLLAFAMAVFFLVLLQSSALAVFYAIYSGGYRKAVEHSLQPEKPKKYLEAMAAARKKQN